MKTILLASNFLIIGHVLRNLCEIVTGSGKELKFVENKTAEDYFETTPTHLKFRQNLPSWLDKDDFTVVILGK